MIGAAPSYTKSKYFVSEPNWHISAEASDKLKELFERDMNKPNLTKIYKQSYPNVKNPFYTWEGKIIDKK